jgi:glutamate racemase
MKTIGVFDSGFGGIHILKGFVNACPEYDYIYLGDTARTPYGSRSKETVYKFTEQAVDFLFKQGCDLVILACFTASSIALRKIQQDYLPKHYPDKRVLGVFVPAVEDVFEESKNKQIGIIATEGTVNSQAFVNEIAIRDLSYTVHQQACPLLVPFVEAGEEDSEACLLMLKKYLAPLLEKNIDTLVLGCTHYGILEKQIRKIVGNTLYIMSGTNVFPQKLKEYLKRHPEIETKLSKNAHVTFYSTDLTEAFSRLGSRFFGKEIKVEKVTL